MGAPAERAGASAELGEVELQCDSPEAPAPDGGLLQVSVYKETADVRLGVSFYDPRDAVELGFTEREAVVKAVAPGSVAADALHPGERIVTVGGVAVESPLHCVEALRGSAGYVRIGKGAAAADFAATALAQQMASRRRMQRLDQPRILGSDSDRGAVALGSSPGRLGYMGRGDSGMIPGLDLATVHEFARIDKVKAPLSARVMNSARAVGEVVRNPVSSLLSYSMGYPISMAHLAQMG